MIVSVCVWLHLCVCLFVLSEVGCTGTCQWVLLVSVCKSSFICFADEGLFLHQRFPGLCHDQPAGRDHKLYLTVYTSFTCTSTFKYLMSIWSSINQPNRMNELVKRALVLFFQVSMAFLVGKKEIWLYYNNPHKLWTNLGMTFLSNSQITRYSGSEIARQQYNFNQKTLLFPVVWPRKKEQCCFYDTKTGNYNQSRTKAQSWGFLQNRYGWKLIYSWKLWHGMTGSPILHLMTFFYSRSE